MRIDIVTLFPAMLQAPLAESILGRARARGLVDIRVHDLREHAAGRHRVTDEPPFGGGGGMIDVKIYDGIAVRNYPVVQGGVLVVVLLFVVTNLLVELSYLWIDPRIRARLKTGGERAA